MTLSCYPDYKFPEFFRAQSENYAHRLYLTPWNQNNRITKRNSPAGNGGAVLAADDFS